MEMTGYTKLFGSIVASTIWREPHTVRIVWITMLAMANKDGIVEASMPGLADLSRVTMDECQEALDHLMSPDKFSRTPDFEGRRVEATNGGWKILNHAKYRAKMGVDERREYLRLKQQEHRKKKASTNVNSVNTESTPSTQSEAEAQSEEEKPSAAKRLPSTDEEWISGLEKKDCYKPLHIRTELAKAQVWCETNRRQCTPRFFTNWINRALESARVVSVSPSAPPAYQTTEWEAWLKLKGHAFREYQFAPEFLKSDFHRDRKVKQ